MARKNFNLFNLNQPIKDGKTYWELSKEEQLEVAQLMVDKIKGTKSDQASNNQSRKTN
jgi:hypothetical protein